MPDEKKERRILSTKSQYNMRAPSMREKASDLLRGAYESVAKQPLARISDALGFSDLAGIANEDPNAMKMGIMPGPPSAAFGKALAPNVTKMHPALPNEFHYADSSKPVPKFQNRTSPIDMNDLPSGKIEYLDPDVAEYMSPTRIDPTTAEGQRRLRFMTGK